MVSLLMDNKIVLYCRRKTLGVVPYLVGGCSLLFWERTDAKIHGLWEMVWVEEAKASAFRFLIDFDGI